MLLVGGGCVNASNTAESDGRSGVSASMRENSMLENPDESVMVTKSSKNFDFEYREAYLPENIDPSASAIFAENNVGRDWGIWGHNLYRIVKVDENADASVYATVNGERYDGQYCFSSQVLHDAIKGYIIDNFGNGDKSSSRFLIMPGDDDAVCNCDLCAKAGNSAGNATPAVSKLVENLAKEFPGHVFFMGAYGSTFMPPVDAMPANVGVMVSAIRWPLSSLTGGKRRTDFDALVREWKEKCHIIYVWDYINNFDDYLTPFPVLGIMQQRLRHYKEVGVRGVFLNGSGEDYSSFSGLHNAVLAALMCDTEADVAGLVRDYFMQNFPASGRLLSDAYLQWETAVMKEKKKLDIYAPVGQAMRYLGGCREFGRFYDALCDAADVATGKERRELERLRSAMSYTMLEVARCSGNVGKFRAKVWLQNLGNGEQYGIGKISESGLTVSDYMKCWEMSILDRKQDNLLAGVRLKALTRLDGSYSDLSVLTDAVNGLPCGYHYGWLISSLDDGLEIEIPVVPQSRRLEVSFLKLTRHRIALPTSIELWQGGECVARQVADDAAEVDMLRENCRRLVYSFDLGGVSSGSTLVLKVMRSKGKINHIAIDEIRLKP